MAGLYDEDFTERLRQGALSLRHEWGLGPKADVRLLTLSENATFLASDPGRAPIILRVHRPAYHTLAEIDSELAWIEALRASGAVDTPAPLRLASGGHVAQFNDGTDTRHVVGFAFMPGDEPSAGESLAPGFELLGAISARAAPAGAGAGNRPRALPARHGISTAPSGRSRCGATGAQRRGWMPRGARCSKPCATF